MKYTKAMTLAWLAALIDGEGSVMLNTRHETARNRGYHIVRPVVSISNTNRALLDKIVERTDIDRVYEHKRPDKANHRSRSYTWRMNVSDIREWGPKLVPHLVIKREQMELLLDALALKATAANPATRDPEHQTKIRTIQDRIQYLNRHGRFSEGGGAI